MADITMDAPGKVLFLMGNEAIARGALEGGVNFASAYPGTPSSEIMDTLSTVAKEMGVYAEWSVNEMVAMEAAAGASMAGLRAMVSMKHHGVAVITDFLSTIVINGIGDGGLVLVSCDDPPALSSSVEGDMRYMAAWMGIPVMEPADFQEAKDMMKALFELSEELGTLCMLRTVTRIAHGRGNVTLGQLPKIEKVAYFDQVHDTHKPMASKYKNKPSATRRTLLQSKLDKAQQIFESSPFNSYVGPDNPELLVITSGSGLFYSREALKTLKLEEKVGILKLGCIYPFPVKLMQKHLEQSGKVLVIEEPDSFIEKSVTDLLSNMQHHAVLYGKQSGHVNLYGEQNPDTVINALTKIFGLTYQSRDKEYSRKADSVKGLVKERSITFCPGCPHRAAYWSIKTALKLDGRGGIMTGDIGCYGMARGAAGFFQLRTLHCMGGGVGVANGLGKLGQFNFNQPVLAACGDSTLFHAAIPGLVNGIINKSNFVLVIFDNNTTAMTGSQPTPNTGVNAIREPTNAINIEAMCRSMGAHVEVCDPFDFKNTTATLLKMMKYDNGAGPRVVIMKRECELIRARKASAPYHMRVNPEKCVGEGCGCDRLCTRVFACPGLTWNKAIGKAEIEGTMCAQCGACADICPQGAIVREAKVYETAQKDPLNLIIAGVGGQGNVAVSQLIGNTLVGMGYFVVVGETYGASQRGGGVMSHVRISAETQYSPIIPRGAADVILGLEPMETLRALGSYGNPNVVTIVNPKPVYPLIVLNGEEEYPDIDTLIKGIKDLSAKTWVIDVNKEAQKLGNPIVANVIVLGVLVGSGSLPLDETTLEPVLRARFPKAIDINMTALKRGMSLAS